ncbi:MAG: hydrogenase/urease maturation nickel metallochaperone HypA [Pseudomonadota bacterium]|nr:hydrogenase/urease maturation nickel metallochaperone HypA [Pseudomonadota bacterium]
MHEHGLIRALLRRIDEIVAAEKADRVVSVQVWMGALCHISDAHFRAHFTADTRGTAIEGANLNLSVSTDIDHPRAQDILLESIEVV